MEYYCCKCYWFNDEFVLCKECSKWTDNVQTTIEKHVSEFKPVVSCKRWKMNKRKNQIQKKYVYINFDYRIDVEFQYKHD